MTDYPNDADGRVLADLARHGVDMAQPLLIEFSVAVPDGRAAVSAESVLSGKGYDIELDYDADASEDHDGDAGIADPARLENADTDEEDSDDVEEADEDGGASWTVYVTRRMLPAYDDIMKFQEELTELTQPFGGYCDGWGALLDEDAGDAD